MSTFINYLNTSDQVYVFFDQKSITEQFRPHSDYVRVEKTIEGYTGGKQNIASVEMFVKGTDYALIQTNEHYLNGFDAINVLDDGSNFELEFFLNEQNPQQKFARVVETSFSSNVQWS